MRIARPFDPSNHVSDREILSNALALSGQVDRWQGTRLADALDHFSVRIKFAELAFTNRGS